MNLESKTKNTMENRKKIRTNIWVNYSFFSGIVIFACMFWIIIAKDSFPTNGDEIRQNYLSLVYVGKWIRTIFIESFKQRRIVVPMFEWSLGYGSDVIKTLSYYGLGDPFYWTSAVVPKEYTEYLYWFLFALRSYFAGLFFVLYCKKKGISDVNSIVSAVFYIISLANISMGQLLLFQPIIIWLPFILYGLEGIFQREKRGGIAYIIGLSVLFQSNIVEAYWASIVIFIYCIVYCIKEKYCKKRVIKLFLSILLISSGAILLTAPINYPLISGMIKSGASKVSELKYFVPYFYDMEYYINLPAQLFTLFGGSYSVYFGFSALSIASVFILFATKQNVSLKVFHIISWFFLIFPVFGHFMNGFSYVSNRWTFMLAFLYSYTFAYIMNEFNNISINSMINSLLLWTVYCVYCSSFRISIYGKVEGVISAGIAAGSIFLCCCSIYKVPGNNRNIKRTNNSILIGLIIWNVVFSIKSIEPNVKTVELGKAFEYTQTQNPLNILNGKDYKVFEKYENEYLSSLFRNQAFALGKSTTEYYWSSLENNIAFDLYNQLGLSANSRIIFSDTDKRSFIENLVGVRYFITKKKDYQIPYGFDNLIAEEEFDSGVYYLYENKFDTKIVNFYDSVLDYNSFCQLPLIDKQEALLQSAIVETSIENCNSKGNKNLYTNVEIPYEIVYDENSISIQDNIISTYGDNASFDICLDSIPKEQSELYVVLKLRKFTPQLNTTNFPNEKIVEMRYQDRKKYYIDKLLNIGYRGVNGTSIKFSFLDHVSDVGYYTDRNKFYNGKEEYVINLGNITGIDDEMRNITVELSKAGEYEIEQMKVFYQPVNSLDQYLEKRNSVDVKWVNTSINRVETEFYVNENGFLQFAIPYSDGWSARIDNKDVDIICTNIMFCGIPVEQGTHTVSFVYKTEGILVGLYIMIGTIIMGIIGYIFLYVNKGNNVRVRS